MSDLSKLTNAELAITLRGYLRINDEMGRVVAGQTDAIREAASRLQAPAVAEVEKALENAEEAVRSQSSPEWVRIREGKYWDGYRDAIEDAADELVALRKRTKK